MHFAQTTKLHTTELHKELAKKTKISRPIYYKILAPDCHNLSDKITLHRVIKLT